MKCKDRRKDARIFCKLCNFFVYCSKTCRDTVKDQHLNTYSRIEKYRREVARLEQNADVAMAIHSAAQGRIQMYDNNHKLLMVYVRARQRVATEMQITAKKFFMNRLWQESNDILEENVKLVGKQNLLVCYEYVLGLLNQGRIEEALAFSIERLLSENRAKNTITSSERRMTHGIVLPFSDELLLNEKNEPFIIYIFISYLIMLSSYSMIQQLLDTFNRTELGRILVGQLSHGPHSIVLSYLVPFSYGDQIFTWEKVKRTRAELQSEIVRLAHILQQRKSQFMVDLNLFSRNKLQLSTSDRRTNEHESRLILLKAKYCILNIPNLPMWLKNISEQSERFYNA